MAQYSFIGFDAAAHMVISNIIYALNNKSWSYRF
jgi:hypothetical protein